MRRCALLLLTALALSFCRPAAALAQDEGLVVRDVRLDEFPRVTLEIDAPAQDGASDLTFQVQENGKAVEVLSAEAADADPMDVFLLIDTSGSMQGAPLEAAKRAARAFADGLQADSRVAVIAFSEKASVAAPLAAGSEAAVGNAIDGLDARGETALYDALRLTGEEAGRAGVRRPLAVLLSDGGDTVSRCALDDAVKALRSEGVPVLVVALPSAEADVSALKIVASQTGGRFVGMADIDTLLDVYDELARGLRTTWNVVYVSRKPQTKDMEIVISANDAGRTMGGAVVAPNPLFEAAASREQGAFEVPRPASRITLAGAGALLFLSVFALVVGLALIFVRPRSALDHVEFYDQIRAAEDAGEASQAYSSKVTSSLVGAIERIAGKRSLDRFVYEQLDRAGLPLRPAEYITLHLVIVIVCGTVGLWATGSVLVALLAVVLGTLVPLAIVDRRIRNRREAFERQLPDVLNLIAGALRAGWGLQQSIDLVVEQMSPPVSTEFSRAQTEMRLGRSVEDALESVAERMRSEDFSWVVAAIAIQRDVGGNLAEVLDLVAETIRDRYALKRQISGLTAEGRLSARILLVLPFVLVVLLSIVNPLYLQGLFSSVSGAVMLAIGSLLLIVGAVWLHRVVTIEV